MTRSCLFLASSSGARFVCVCARFLSPLGSISAPKTIQKTWELRESVQISGNRTDSDDLQREQPRTKKDTKHTCTNDLHVALFGLFERLALSLALSSALRYELSVSLARSSDLSLALSA